MRNIRNEIFSYVLKFLHACDVLSDGVGHEIEAVPKCRHFTRSVDSYVKVEVALTILLRCLLHLIYRTNYLQRNDERRNEYRSEEQYCRRDEGALCRC